MLISLRVPSPSYPQLECANPHLPNVFEQPSDWSLGVAVFCPLYRNLRNCEPHDLRNDDRLTLPNPVTLNTEWKNALSHDLPTVSSEATQMLSQLRIKHQRAPLVVSLRNFLSQLGPLDSRLPRLSCAHYYIPATENVINHLIYVNGIHCHI